MKGRNQYAGKTCALEERKSFQQPQDKGDSEIKE